MYLTKVISDENGTPIEINLLCEKCGNTIIIKNDIDNKFNKITSDYCMLKDGSKIECLCKNVSNTNLITRKELPSTQNRTKLSSEYRPKHTLQNIPKCPICQSTNLSKISTTKKVAKIAVFGIFGMGDNGKIWKCNNCGSKF
ncbi:hypothetical protein [Clostridium sp. HBUAS56010]|uniref:hypothetical protein n=1 Tax=Clostridium sp. HBUAS56010 TaxID=2571127 RepID=UPI0011785837|nr:hypothetical protein [Clostridium sp. HBUAS56010]